MKLKLIALAAMLAAGSAHATIDNGQFSGDGEMFLVVNDAIAGYSFAGDLGITMDGFNGAVSQSFDLNSFSQWGSFMTAIGGNLDNANFVVLAQDSTGQYSGGDRMLISTSAAVSAEDIEATKNGSFTAAPTQMNGWLASLNNSTDVVGGDMDSVANGSSYSVAGSSTYFDDAIGSYLKNKLAYSVYADANEAANFGLQVTGASALGTSIYAPFDGVLTVNGTTLAYTVAAVPEAETYAMMLAGLGLVGFMVARRRAV